MLRQNCSHSSSATQNTINFCEKSQSIIAGTIIMYIYNTTENRNINLLSNPYALLPRVFRHYSKSPLQQQWVIPLSCFESYSIAIWLWWFEIRTNSSKTILIIPFSQWIDSDSKYCWVLKLWLDTQHRKWWEWNILQLRTVEQFLSEKNNARCTKRDKDNNFYHVTSSSNPLNTAF